MRPLGMIKLDFLAMKTQALPGVLASVWLVFLFKTASLVTVFLTCAWYLALMFTTVFAIEEKNGLRKLYGMLALRVKDIVLGRYLFMLSGFLIVVVGLLLLSSFLPFLGLTTSFAGGLHGLGISLLFFVVMTGFQLPLFFKLGYTRARFWAMAPFLLIGLIPLVLTKIEGLQATFLEGIGFFTSYQPFNISVIIALAALIFFGSYRLSLILYEPLR